MAYPTAMDIYDEVGTMVTGLVILGTPVALAAPGVIVAAFVAVLPLVLLALLALLAAVVAAPFWLAGRLVRSARRQLAGHAGQLCPPAHA